MLGPSLAGKVLRPLSAAGFVRAPFERISIEYIDAQSRLAPQIILFGFAELHVDLLGLLGGVDLELSFDDRLLAFLDTEFVAGEDQTMLFRVVLGLASLLGRNRLPGALEFFL